MPLYGEKEARMQTFSPILIHVPHAATLIPSDEWQYFVTDNLKKEVICMTDHYCDDLFSCNHEMIRFPVSRLICDVERFRDDSLESMAAKGMGVVYTHGLDGKRIKEVPDYHKEEILTSYYDCHHKRLEAEVQRRLDTFNRCLIIDGHSFYESPLPYEYNQKIDRPDICIGTDIYHTPKELEAKLCKAFMEKGYSVALNTPFAGSLVPLKYYEKDKRVFSIMIEINRRLYIDRDANKIAGYQKIKKDIVTSIESL